MVRIACVQFDPHNGKPEENANTVRRLTKSLGEDDVDVVMLPEMALSGYLFDSKADVEPLLEDPSQGSSASPSYALAVELAKRLQCYVSVGFPCRSSCFASPGPMWDRARDGEHGLLVQPFDARPVKREQESDQGAYNASLLVDKNGSIVHIFRKHFAFEPDRRWSGEGPGFETVTLPGLGKVCVAICMDINPYDFSEPFEKYELARFCRKNQVDWLLMNLAWLRADADTEEDKGDRLSAAARQHCNYLALRLSPYFEGQTDDHKPHPIRLITCNRIGTERTTTFAGYSNALYFDDQSLPKLVGCSGMGEELTIFDVLEAENVSI
jgi:protein N-terminal amidase